MCGWFSAAIARASCSKRAGDRIGAELVGQDLDRDDASEPRVARLLDLAHPACAKGRDDFIRAKADARGEGHEIAVDYMVGVANKDGISPQ